MGLISITLRDSIQGDLKIDTPENWDDLDLEISRSKKFHGIIQNFVKEFVFRGNAVPWLINIKNTQGLAASTRVYLYRLDENIGEYVLLFDGFLDWKTLKPSRSQDRVTLAMATKPDKITEDFNNNLKTKISLQSQNDLNGDLVALFDEKTDVLFHSLPILKKTIVENDQNSTISMIETGMPDSGWVDLGTTKYYWFWTIDYDNETLTEVTEYHNYINGLLWELEDYNTLSSASEIAEILHSPYSNNLFILETTERGEYFLRFTGRLTLNVELASGAGNSYRFGFIYVRAKDVLGQNTIIDAGFMGTPQTGTLTAGTSLNTSIFSLYGNTFLDVEKGEEFYIFPFFELLIEGDVTFNNLDLTIDQAKLEFEATTVDFEYNVTTVLMHEAFSRAFNIITGKKDAVQSTFFGRTDSLPRSYASDGKGSIQCVTNGYQLRGYPLTDILIAGDIVVGRPIELSFEDLYDAENSKYNLGLEIADEVCTIEEKAYFYDDATVIDLGCFIDVETELLLDELYLHVSQENNWKNTENALSGLDEFVSSREYNTGLSEVENKLELSYTFLHDGYSIETTKRQRFQAESLKETQKDEDVFCIKLRRNSDPDPYYFKTDRWDALDVDNMWESVTGVKFPEWAFNVAFSFGRTIRNWGNVLVNTLSESYNKTLKILRHSANNKLQSKLLSETEVVLDNQDLAKEDLGDGIYGIYLYKIEGPLELSKVQEVLANPKSKFQFNCSDSLIYTGYLSKFSVNVETLKCDIELKSTYNSLLQ